jgi:hypothetical protein
MNEAFGIANTYLYPLISMERSRLIGLCMLMARNHGHTTYICMTRSTNFFKWGHIATARNAYRYATRITTITIFYKAFHSTFGLMLEGQVSNGSKGLNLGYFDWHFDSHHIPLSFLFISICFLCGRSSWHGSLQTASNASVLLSVASANGAYELTLSDDYKKISFF